MVLTMLAASMASGFTYAADNTSFTVKDITVEGLTRIDEGTVFNGLPVGVGDSFSTSEAPKAISELFATGYFEDIKLYRDGDTLVIVVKERPSIGKIDVEGNHDISSEDLTKALDSVGIAEGRTFEPSVLNRVEQELEQQYFSRGKYSVEITSEVKKLDRNRVAISINIVEGDAAKIKSISLVGNKAFSDEVLLDEFKLTSPTWLSWLTNDDQYAKEKLRGDLESLRSFYQDRGYINFKVDSTQVSITPSKQDIYIVANLDEGQRYTVSSIKLDGQLIASAELEQLVKIKSGDVYSRRALAQLSNKIVDRLGDEGYAFARVNVVRDLDEENKTVALTLFVDPGSRVYVRRINYIGNDTTDSEVLRREMRQFEASPVSTARVQRSKTNLMLLGFFEDVNIETKPVPGTTNQVDLDVKISERNSGQVSGGIGYSQIDGLLFNVGVKQSNFLGSGKLVDFNFNHSNALSTYRIGYNNPYYTVNGVSRGFDLYYQDSDLKELNIANYTRDRAGATVSYGIPVSEHDRASLSLNFERTEVKESSDVNSVSTQIRDFLAKEGNEFNMAKVTASWTHNDLDRAVFPTSGYKHTLRTSATIPTSTLEYYEVSLNNAWYIPIKDDRYIMQFRSTLAYGDGYRGTDELPFFENFYAGGIGSVRGFRGNTLGPRDSNGDPLGGNVLAAGTAEFIFPMPFTQTKALRTSVFADVGNVFSSNDDALKGGQSRSADGFRASVGVSAQWMSPIGPFVFSFAEPLKDRKQDELESFQFTIGTTF